MTEQEAIECIEDVLSATINYDESLDYQLTSFDIDWLSKAKETLAKQIPKKPILDTIFPSCIIWWRCPVCNKIIVSCIAGRPHKYCDDCGQALDWSDDE